MHMKHSIISPWLVPELTGAQWVEPLPQASYIETPKPLHTSSERLCLSLPPEPEGHPVTEL